MFQDFELRLVSAAEADRKVTVLRGERRRRHRTTL